MVSLKEQSFFILLVLTALTVIGCSPAVAPNPTMPTPLPVVVQANAAQPTTPAVKSNPKSNDAAREATEEASPNIDDPAIEKEVVVDSLYLWIEHLFPVKARVTVGGYLPDNCVEISGWEQSLNGNALFARPIITRPAGATCSNSQIRFEEDIDMDVKGLSVSELANGDYFLDANGWTMPLSPSFAAGLLDEDLSNCPLVGEGQILYFNEQAGFCLLFPDTFKMQDDEAPGVAGFYGPPLDEHTIQPLQAVLYVNYQEPAQGRTLEQIADERRATYEGTDVELEIRPSQLDGQPALLIESEGEMARTLQIVSIYEDLVYAISVSPYDEAFPQAADDVRLVWDLALASFTFRRPPTDQASDQANSPDVGQLLTFLVRSPDGPALWPPRLGDIGTMYSDGSQRRQLTTYGYNANPVLSPDGAFIAYRSVPSRIASQGDPLTLHEALNKELYNIWVITTDGTQAWQLTESEETRSKPTWSPDGRYVAFSQGQNGELVEIDMGNQSSRVLTQGASAPKYKPDASIIGFITQNGGLAWLDASGGIHTIVDGESLPDNIYIADFDWLGASSFLIYTLADDSERIRQSTVGIRYNVYVAALNGAESYWLADNIHSVQASADGTIVAGLSGSGYADCLSDLEPRFLLLAPDFASAEMIRIEDLDGYPQDLKDYLYPVSNFVWVRPDQTMVEVQFTCTPDRSTDGWYLADPIERTMMQVVSGN